MASQWNAKTKRQVSMVASLLAGLTLLGWLGGFLSGFNIAGISVTMILGIYMLYNFWMLYKKEY